MLFGVEARTLGKHRVSSTWGPAEGTQQGDWVLEDTSPLGCFPDKGSPFHTQPSKPLPLPLKGYPSPPGNKWMLLD